MDSPELSEAEGEEIPAPASPTERRSASRSSVPDSSYTYDYSEEFKWSDNLAADVDDDEVASVPMPEQSAAEVDKNPVVLRFGGVEITEDFLHVYASFIVCIVCVALGLFFLFAAWSVVRDNDWVVFCSVATLVMLCMGCMAGGAHAKIWFRFKAEGRSPGRLVYVGREQNYSSQSFGLFAVDHPARYAAIRLVDHRYFERTVVFLVFVNSVCFAVEPAFPGNSFEIVDRLFVVLFTVEMLIKFVASGVVLHSTAYCRDSWNLLDLFAVLAGWLSLLPDVERFQAVRALRILRPLRSVKQVRGLRVIVATLFSSVPTLLDVLFVVCFVFLVFAVLGLQVWSGLLRLRCTHPDTGVTDTACYVENYEEVSRGTCAYGYTCEPLGQNPDYGLTSFDNIGVSLLTVFRIFSLDKWGVIMELIAVSWPTAAWVYFALLVFFAFAFALPFLLVVLFDKFTVINFDANGDKEEQYRRRMAGARFTVDDGASANRRNTAGREEHSVPVFKMVPPPPAGGLVIAPGFDDLDDDDVELEMDERPRGRLRIPPDLIPYDSSGLSVSSVDEQYERDPWSIVADEGERAVHVKVYAWALKHVEDWGFLEDEEKVLDRYLEKRPYFKVVQVVVTSMPFNVFIGFCIFANTAILAMQHVGMSDGLHGFIERANVVFFVIFLLEMLFKMLGMGIVGYLKDPWRWFDSGIVLAGVLELAFNTASVRAFRAFRQVRLFKLVARYRYPRKCILAIRNALRPATFVLFLLLLFCYITSIVGVDFFRDITVGSQSRHVDFSNFWTGFLTVFISTIGKGWSDVLYVTASQNRVNGILYSLVLFCVGHLIFLDLFICVLLDAWIKAEESIDDSRSDCDNEDGTEFRARSLLHHAQNLETITTVDHSIPLHLRRDRTRASGMQGVVSSEGFEVAVEVVIILGSVLIVLQNNVDAGVIFVSRTILTALLALELLLRVIFLHGRKLLRSPYFCLDVGVLVAMSIGLTLGTSPVGSTTLSSFWILRLLRSLSRLRVVRVTLHCLLITIPRLIGPCITLMMTCAIFAIMGQELFQGRFMSCSDHSFPSMESCERAAGNFTEGTAPHWGPPPINFDNFANALWAMFVVVARVDWYMLMFTGFDTPDRNMTVQSFLFFALFVVLSTFFILPLFMCVVLDTFREVTAQLPSSVYIPHGQRSQRLRANLVKATEPSLKFTHPPPTTCAPLRQPFYMIASHRYFEWTVLAVIAFNTLFLCAHHYGATPMWTSSLALANYVFVGIFAVEFVIKLIGLGREYYNNQWNCFDFTVLLVSVAGIIAFRGISSSSAVLSIFRILRVLRVFRIVGSHTKFYALFLTILNAVPAVLAVGLVAIVFMLHFAVFIMPMHEGAVNWYDGVMLSFRVLTTDIWTEALPPDRNALMCLTMTVFFLGMLVLGAVFAVIIFDTYGEALGYAGISSEYMSVLREFRRLWNEYDPKKTKYIDGVDLIDLFARLPKPFDIDLRNEHFLFKRNILPMTDTYQVAFLPTFCALGELLLNVEISDDGLPRSISLRQLDLCSVMQSGWPERCSQDETSGTESDAADVSEQDGGTLPVHEYAQRMWAMWNKDGDTVMDLKETQAMMENINKTMDDTSLKKTLRRFNVKNNVMNYSKFVEFLGDISIHPKVKEVYSKYATSNVMAMSHVTGPEEFCFIDVKAFASFMVTCQNQTMTAKEISNLFHAFNHTKNSKVLSLEGFQEYLTSEFNSIVNSEQDTIYHDMTRPLPEYWIATSSAVSFPSELSHQDADEQLQPYVRMLRLGCRCLELEVHEDTFDLGQPIVVHRHGRTGKMNVSLAGILRTIKKHAFETSAYPVILSLELFCSPASQDLVALNLQGELGSSIAPMHLFEGTVLPSPHDLRQLFVLKGSLRIAPGGVPDTDDTTDDDAVESSPDFVTDSKRSGTDSKRSVPMAFSDMLSEMLHLQTEKFPGIKEVSHQDYIRQLRVVHRASSSKMAHARKCAVDMMGHTLNNMVRVDGSNSKATVSDASAAWNVGCQLVAMNYGDASFPMFLHQGKFRDNAQCGYIAKPWFMCDEQRVKAGMFDPGAFATEQQYCCFTKKTTHHLTPDEILKVKVMGARMVPKVREDCVVSPFVQVGLVGVNSDHRSAKRTKTILGNGFNPVWEETFEFAIYNVIFAMLYFVVYDHDIGAGGTDQVIGYAACPATNICTGYRNVVLYDLEHMPLKQGSVLVHISKLQST